jgi:peptidoglycan/LPS O-acetylase OafA/YrhL
MPSRNADELHLLRKYMPELDVLRGMAILSVVLYQLGVNLFPLRFFDFRNSA